jgi:hypothetical protein
MRTLQVTQVAKKSDYTHSSMLMVVSTISGESSRRIHLGRTHTLKFSLPPTTYDFDKNCRTNEQSTKIEMLPFNNRSINNRCFN